MGPDDYLILIIWVGQAASSEEIEDSQISQILLISHLSLVWKGTFDLKKRFNVSQA